MGNSAVSFVHSTHCVLNSTLLCFAASGSSDGGGVEFGAFEFTVEPSDTVAVRGQPAILNCSAQHDGAAPTMQWVRDDVYIQFDGETRRSVTPLFALEKLLLRVDEISVQFPQENIHNLCGLVHESELINICTSSPLEKVVLKLCSSKQ